MNIVAPADWSFKHLLNAVIALTAALVLFICLGLAGIDVPVLRQLTGFLFLSFVPGVLILRILRVHRINPVESLGYSAGLSLAFVMFSGALLNFALPLLGIHSPLNLFALMATFVIATIVLAVAAYFRDRDFQPEQPFKWPPVKELLPALFLVLLLALTILGANLIYAFGNNLLLIICLALIGLIVILAACGKFITPPLFPAAIFIISLCLLYQTTLISPLLIGTDVYVEYQFAQLVLNSGIWAYSLPGTVNSCLSIVIMAPVYSQVMNLDLVYVFKIIYPLFFSLVPLLLYRIFRMQIGDRGAFLAAFFFMAMPTFSLEMISLCRQQIAELFFALFILLCIERRIQFKAKIILMIIFPMFIAASHYALGFINFGYLGLMLVFVIIMRTGCFLKAWEWLTRKTGGLPAYMKEPGAGGLPLIILAAPIILYLLLGITWAGLTASGSSLKFLENTLSSQFADTARAISAFFSPAHLSNFGQGNALIMTALGLDFSQVSLPGKIFRILQYLTQFFIIAGCLRLLIKPSGLKFRIEYIGLSLVSLGILAACIMLPDFADRLNITRWYHIALITLAPFCILGAGAVWDIGKSLLNKIRTKAQNAPRPGVNSAFYIAVSCLLLVPYFIFTSGIVYEITTQQDTESVDTPFSIALTAGRVDIVGIFNQMDQHAPQWLFERAGDRITVYSDYHAENMLIFVNDKVTAGLITLDSKFQGPSYIYLRSWNTQKGEITFTIGKAGLRKHVKIQDVTGLADTLSRSDRIYSNGGAQIFFTR